MKTEKEGAVGGRGREWTGKGERHVVFITGLPTRPACGACGAAAHSAAMPAAASSPNVRMAREREVWGVGDCSSSWRLSCRGDYMMTRDWKKRLKCSELGTKRVGSLD